MSGVNLLPSHYLAARRRRRRARRWALGVTGYAALLIVGWLALRLVGGGAHRAVADQLGQTERRLTESRTALEQLRPRLREALATLEAGQSVGDPPDWSILMRLVADRLGEGAVLSRFQLVPAEPTAAHRMATRYELRLEGLARTQAAVSRYVLELEGLGLFESVQLRSTRREPWGEGSAVSFKLVGELGGGGDE